MLTPTILYMKVLWSRLQQLREDDRGMTTEAIVVTGILVLLAIAVIGLIRDAVTSRAEEIESDIEGTLGILRGTY